MGDGEIDVMRLHFALRLRLEFHGSSVTSNACLLAYRELDETLALTGIGSAKMADQQGRVFNGHFECTCYHLWALSTPNIDPSDILGVDGKASDSD